MAYKSIALLSTFVLMFSSAGSAQEASCSDLASSTDQNYCRSIESASMLPSLTGGVSGDICGYEQKREACQYSVPYPTAIETINLERKDHHWFDHDIQPHCDALVQKHSSSDVHVTRVTFGGHVFGDVCYKRDWKRKCVKWTKKVSVTCTLERQKKNFDANSDQCSIVNDQSRPKECAAAHQADTSALDRRRIEADAVLAVYKREVDLYKNLEKVMSKLIDAKKNLVRFEYQPEDVQKLRDLSDLLVEKSAADASFQNFETTVLNVVEIVESVGANVPTGDASEIAQIQEQLDGISKELKGKERIIYLLNVRLGEINQKLVYAQSRS